MNIRFFFVSQTSWHPAQKDHRRGEMLIECSLDAALRVFLIEKVFTFSFCDKSWFCRNLELLYHRVGNSIKHNYNCKALAFGLFLNVCSLQHPKSFVAFNKMPAAESSTILTRFRHRRYPSLFAYFSPHLIWFTQRQDLRDPIIFIILSWWEKAPTFWKGVQQKIRGGGADRKTLREG